jgi:hypothetical protein
VPRRREDECNRWQNAVVETKASAAAAATRAISLFDLERSAIKLRVYEYAGESDSRAQGHTVTRLNNGQVLIAGCFAEGSLMKKPTIRA